MKMGKLKKEYRCVLDLVHHNLQKVCFKHNLES